MTVGGVSHWLITAHNSHLHGLPLLYCLHLPLYTYDSLSYVCKGRLKKCSVDFSLEWVDGIPLVYWGKRCYVNKPRTGAKERNWKIRQVKHIVNKSTLKNIIEIERKYKGRSLLTGKKYERKLINSTLKSGLDQNIADCNVIQYLFYWGLINPTMRIRYIIVLPCNITYNMILIHVLRKFVCSLILKYFKNFKHL